MDTLIRWSLRNRAAVVAVALILTVVGVTFAARMPVDVFPDLTAPTVTVITEAHGMAPVEVESQITLPIESALNGAAGVRRVRSSTAVGISIVWAEFDWGTDIYAARQVVNEKLSLVIEDLPPEVERPVLAPISSIMGEILFISLTSEKHTSTELHTIADTVVRRRLLSIPGVAQVTPTGGGEKQYQVVLSPSKLKAYGVSIRQVTEALEASNENVSAGFINEGGVEYLVTGVGRARTPDDIGRTVVAAVDGVPVTVADLGDVRIGEGPKRGEGSANARPAVIIGIQKQPEANTLALTRQLDLALDKLRAEPQMKHVKIDRHIFRQADFIEIAIENVMTALKDGALLVVLIVVIFLMNVRATLITLTAIPLSLLTSLLVLHAMDATINTMTLGGLAIAIGALVDDSIIDVENVFRRLRLNALLPEPRPLLQVVIEASIEIRASIVFATMIILLVFLPIFFLPGVEGRLLRPLGLAYTVALFSSLIVAVTVTPVLCYLLMTGSRAVKQGREPRLVALLKSAYAPLLQRVLARPVFVVMIGVGFLAAAIAGALFLGREFLPEFNEGAWTISAVTLPGTSLPESDELARVAEKTLMQHPEVRSVARRTGRAELSEHAMGVESSELDVSFTLKERSREEFTDAVRRDLAMIPGLNITIGQPISHRIDHMLSGTRATIAVKIFGDDLNGLRDLAERARREMAAVPGVVDLSVEPQVDVPMLQVRLDRGEIARHGLRVHDVVHTLEAALQGVRVSRVMEGRNGFDLVLRIAESEGWTTGTLGDVPIDTAPGAKVPLRSVATLAKETGPNVVNRENVERKIVVMCNVAGRDVASVVADCRRRIDPIVVEKTGYHVEYGGQFEAAEQAGKLLAGLTILVIVGIGFILHVAFRSGRDALLVMVNLPLALIGGVAGVYVSGGVLSVASLIGFITVFGIATRNGIMLVSHIRHLQQHEGVTDFREAVFRGALERLTPILMTALAAGLALIPLALGGGKPGNEIQTPMAIVILFGLLSSMLLNMIVVPALYLRFGRPVDSGGGS